MTTNQNHIVGEFEVKSGKILVTDPCYPRDPDLQGTLENVKNGVYVAVVNRGTKGGWGVRNAELLIVHKDLYYSAGGQDINPVDITDIDVGVDSGQAGFFCDSIYPHGDIGEYGDLNTFYGRACAASNDEDSAGNGPLLSAGIVDGAGVVSGSGFGDGEYDCYISKNKDGQIVAARIVFISDESDEETDDEYDDDEEDDNSYDDDDSEDSDDDSGDSD